MMHINLVQFENLFDTQPTAYGCDLTVLNKALLEKPITVNSKAAREKLISFATYKPNAERGNDGVETVTAVVLDFDNKPPNPDHIKNTLSNRLVKEHVHLWHTTYSHTAEIPRWRLIFPLADAIKPAELEPLFNQVVAAFNHDPAIDPVGKKPAQAYFIPYKQQDGLYTHGLKLMGKCLSVKSFRPIHPVEQTDHGYHLIKSKEDLLLLGAKLNKFRPTAEGGVACCPAHDDKNPSLKLSFKAGRFLAHCHSGCSFEALNAAFNALGFTDLPEKAKKLNMRVPLKEAVPAPETHEEETLYNWSKYSNIDIYDLRPFPLLRSINGSYQQNIGRLPKKLALGATIAVAGFLLKNYYKIIPEGNSSTHFFIFNIAESGVGKDKIMGVTQEILESKQVDLSKYFENEIGSGPALIQKIGETDNRLFLSTDEIADYFSTITGNQANSFKTEILKLLKQLFSGQKFKSGHYKHSGSKIIEDPFVTCLFTGTPEFFACITAKELANGFMSRFLLLLEPSDDYGLSSEELRGHKKEIIVQILQKEGLPCGTTARLSEEAWIEYDLFRKYQRAKYEELDHGDLRKYLFKRIVEQALRLSYLTIDHTGIVSRQGFLWAVAVVIESIKSYFKVLGQYYGKTDLSKNTEKVRRALERLALPRNNFAVSYRDLLRSTNISSKYLDLALKELELLERVVFLGDRRNKNGTTSKMIHFKTK